MDCRPNTRLAPINFNDGTSTTPTCVKPWVSTHSPLKLACPADDAGIILQKHVQVHVMDRIPQNRHMPPHVSLPHYAALCKMGRDVRGDILNPAHAQRPEAIRSENIADTFKCRYNTFGTMYNMST